MPKKNRQVLEIILSIIALVIIISIFLKAIIDVDTNYDVGWYHLPFAARIWGIVPEKSFISEKLIEYRFDGFPLLANFLQGLLWKITGRIQATNLVAYLSLIIYFLFLRSYFKVPLYLSVIAIFTIPAVLTHATTSFVDLPGNIGVAIVMMMTYSFFRQSKLPRKGELLIVFLGAATAANTKPQLQPLIFLLYWIVGIRLIWLYFKHSSAGQRKLWLTIPLAAIASGLIFATPIKNVALYGNPFYPIKIEVAGIVLNHQLTPKTYSEGNRSQKWLQSILEINTPQWSADQWNGGNPRNLDRAGGFFGAYVVFNLLLLIGLTIKEQLQKRAGSAKHKSSNATTALAIILLVSLVPANFPQSHELRYFMFWMITLVSLMMAYVLYQQQDNPSRRDLWVIFLAGVGSSNSKPQLEPLVFIVLSAIAIRILWLRWRSTNRQQLFTWLLKAIPVALLASLIIFATPMKNIAIHGNPFYPVRIEIAGQVLNHTLPMYSDAPGYLADAPTAQRWLYSILEINSAYWNHDQYSKNPDRNRMGGFFGAYVVFQILLLIYLIAKNRDRHTKLAGIVVIVMSLIAANFPQSHELRYFMYWMMVLISLNLYLVTHHQNLLIKPSRVGLISLIALIIVGIKTNFIYLAPHFNTLARFKQTYLSREIIAKIEPGDKICLPNTYPYAFAYTPWFHQELDFTYRVRSGFKDPCAKSEKVL